MGLQIYVISGDSPADLVFRPKGDKSMYNYFRDLEKSKPSQRRDTWLYLLQFDLVEPLSGCTLMSEALHVLHMTPPEIKKTALTLFAGYQRNSLNT